MESELFLYTDSESLYSKLKHEEKLQRLKQRWLMGLALSDYDHKRLNGDGILSTHHNNNDKILPESFLRQDDVFYDTVKAFVEKGFVAMIGRRGYHDVTQTNIWTSDFPSHITEYISILDDMTNNGLLLVAQLLSGGSFMFEKARWKMKKVIKQRLPQLLLNLKTTEEKTRAQQLCEILQNPQNFHANISKFSSHAHQKLHAAALKVLAGLEDMDSLTLSAIHRKLRGTKGYMPQLQPKKSGWARSVLIDHIRKMCSQMLSELGENDELQEPLAKAMAIATLSSSLLQGSPSLVVFQRFSSEIIVLQNEIAKAITILDGKGTIRFPELMRVQIFLDPNANLSNRSLRKAVRNLLEEFLFECSDLDPIPEYLFETLSIISQTSRSAPFRIFSKEEIEEDVENVLCVSAQMKQILWDLLPEYEYDNDFADAYMEDLEDSDDGVNYNDDSSDDFQELSSEEGRSFGSVEGYDRIEATGETSPVHGNDVSAGDVPRHITETNLMDYFPSTSLCLLIDNLENMEEDQLHRVNLNPSTPQIGTNGSNSSSHLQLVESSKGDHIERQKFTVNPEKPPELFSSTSDDRLCTGTNQYLDVQEACDKTSLVAYKLIGCLLEEFAQKEGFDFDSVDSSYLRGENLSCNVARAAAKEEHISYGEADHGSVIAQVLEELLPSFPESGKEKVKELMGLK